jgi:tetratricopeptide (TPR) repeat protein
VAAGYLVIVTGNRWLLRSLEQDVRGPLEQLLTQAKGLLYYLHLLTLPTHLSVEPQFFVLGSASVLVVSLSMALSAVGGAVALWRGRCRRALFLILWLLLYMLPTIVVPLNVLVNERRAYMPLAVACVAAGLLLVPALQRLRARPLLAVVSVLMLAVLSVQRTQVWADEMTLWRDAVVKGPGMSRAHLYLGNAHKDLAQHATDEAYRQQQWLAAAAAFERASATARGLDLALRALNNRGGVFFTLGDQALDEGRRAEALEHYERAEEIYRAVEARNPIYADALINLGNSTLIRARLTPGLSAAQRQKLLRESVAYYQRALEVRPNHSQGHSNLGVAYDDLGDWELAEARYRHALHLDGRDWLTMKNLAHLLQRRAGADIEAGRLGVAAERLQQARHLIDQALRLNPAVPGGRQVRDEIEARGRALRGGG